MFETNWMFKLENRNETTVHSNTRLVLFLFLSTFCLNLAVLFFFCLEYILVSVVESKVICLWWVTGLDPKSDLNPSSLCGFTGSDKHLQNPEQVFTTTTTTIIIYLSFNPATKIVEPSRKNLVSLF